MTRKGRPTARQLPAQARRTKAAALEDLLPRLPLLPHESETGYEGLRAALIADLAPARPYEVTLAETLVTLEWEAIRYRQMRHAMVQSELRSLIAHHARFQEWPFAGYEDAGLADLLDDLFSDSPERRAAAGAALDSVGIEVASLATQAWSDCEDRIEIHDRRLQEIERRRRRLFEDYRRLQDARRPPAEDAETVGPG